MLSLLSVAMQEPFKREQMRSLIALLKAVDEVLRENEELLRELAR
jgi:hypothetical protein